MANEISEIKNNIFNTDGNIVLDEKFDGGGRTQTIKYGLIKLIGNKQEHRVSMKTIIDITKAREAKFAGQINIPELNMSVHISQIVMMRSEIENIKVMNNYTNLSTETIYLDKDFYLLTGIRSKIERENDLYYIDTCHYIFVNEVKQYYLEPEQIQYLVTMVRDEDPDYPHYIKKATKYGRDVREIHKEQEKKKNR